VKDLSNLLPGDPVTALAPTSQAGGNMMSDNKLAGTAPGSQPVDPLPPAKEQADPKITASNAAPIQPGDDGKPSARAGRERGGLSLPEPSWKTTT
jgi:hypothetical protein